MQVELWICENGHYYGSSSTHGVDLTKEENFPSTIHGGRSNPPTGTRSTCGICQKPRIKVVAEVPTPSIQGVVPVA